MLLLILALASCEPVPVDDTGEPVDTDTGVDTEDSDTGETGDTDTGDTPDTGDTDTDTGSAGDTGDQDDTSDTGAIDTGDTGGHVDPIVLEEYVADTASAGDQAIEFDRSWAFAIVPNRGYITGVDVYVQGPGDAGDALRVEIHGAGDNGAPDGAALVGETVPASEFPTGAPDFVHVDFTEQIAVLDATVYWVVVELVDEDHSSYGYPVFNTGVTNQLAYQELPAGAWTVYDDKTYDWPHRVWGVPSP